MPKKKLLLILGAGSSVAHGMPSVADVGTAMRQWSAAWADLYPGGTNFFEHLWAKAEAYAALEPKVGLRQWVSFEPILGQMIQLMDWMKPAPFGSSFRTVITGSHTTYPPEVSFTAPSFNPKVFPNSTFVESNLVKTQAGDLLSKLAKLMRERSLRLNESATQFIQHCELMQGLRDRFDLGVYNLNYDTVALRSLPGIFTGFAGDGTFAQAEVHRRPCWDFLYHLHGSVHHSLTTPGSDIEWRPNLRDKFNDGVLGQSVHDAADHRSVLKTTLIAGGGKLDQLQLDPYLTFYSTLVRHCHEADAVVLGGYGFADLHLNHALRQRFRSSSRPPLLILTKACDKPDPMEFRADRWSDEFLKTAAASATSFSGPVDITELVAQRGFEVSPKNLIGIWHGGFDSAAVRRREIAEWLSRETSGLP